MNAEADSPEPSVLGCGSSRDDFGDEDAGVFTDVGVVCAARDAEAQSRVTLDTTTIAMTTTIKTNKTRQQKHRVTNNNL